MLVCVDTHLVCWLLASQVFQLMQVTSMASWQYATVVAALLVIGASAQETTVAVTTLASGNNSDFVYVPTALVDGDLNSVSVRRSADPLGHPSQRCV